MVNESNFKTPATSKDRSTGEEDCSGNSSDSLPPGCRLAADARECCQENGVVAIERRKGGDTNS